MSLTLGWIHKCDIKELDVFNHQNTRTKKDIKKLIGQYNCMSYVFGAYEWLLPFDPYREDAEDILSELNIDDYDDILYNEVWDALDETNYSNAILMALAVKRMLKMFPDLRQIESFDDLEDDEYGIVYAACDYDFHFGRYDDGIWSHKVGNGPIYQEESEYDIFEEKYYSQKFYFAMKKGEVRYEC